MVFKMGRRGMKWTQSWSKSLQNACKLLCKFMIKHNLVSFFVKYLEEVKVQYLRKQKHIQILKCNSRRGYIFQLTLTTVYSAAQACIIRETKHTSPRRIRKSVKPFSLPFLFELHMPSIFFWSTKIWNWIHFLPPSNSPCCVHMSSWPGCDIRRWQWHLPWCRHSPGVMTDWSLSYVTLISWSETGRQSTNRSGDKKIWTVFVFTYFCLSNLIYVVIEEEDHNESMYNVYINQEVRIRKFELILMLSLVTVSIWTLSQCIVVILSDY